MWRSLWRSIDRFSLQHFKFVINELQGIRVVDNHNRDLVVDLLQAVVEIVTYGDRQDPLIFECFMEFQILAEFVRLLKISRNSRIEAPLLQYLSIMIQNMESEHAIYYCFSNDHVNNIISHQYRFDGGDLAPYYISFLRAVSNKINKDTLCLLVRVQEDVVVSFPLYTEALKFAQHGEKMIQTAVRALTLNIYNVSDDMVFQFVTTPPASKYFSDLVNSLKVQCVNLDSVIHSAGRINAIQRRKELLLETDKIVDDLYYFKDILCVNESRLKKVVIQNLLDLLVFPILLQLLQLRQNDGSNLSAVTSLYIVSRLLQVVGGTDIVKSVAALILQPSTSSNIGNAGEQGTDNSFSNHLNDLEKLVSSGLELVCHPMDDNICPERFGIMAFISSNDHTLLLASLFLLLTIVESKDLEYSLASMIGLNVMQQTMILNALLKVLASEPPNSVLRKWHTGWFLRKLLLFQEKGLDENTCHLFNTSYEQSLVRFQKELDGCWFDYIVDTFRNEWASCKKALEEPSQFKDPFFLLELIACQQIVDENATSSRVSWQRMVDTVKDFILHLQLKAFICKGELPEKPLLDSTSSDTVDSGRTHASDVSSASFGSEVSLASGAPCRISFSNAGIRDIYIIAVARGISGKLLLVEKHPFRSQRGVVMAIAPLAGLNPKIDEEHTTWLHLRIREFDPRSNAITTKAHYSKVPTHASDGRWTLGFPNAKACETARLMILELTNKQRSSVTSALAPLLQNNYLKG